MVEIFFKVCYDKNIPKHGPRRAGMIPITGGSQ